MIRRVSFVCLLAVLTAGQMCGTNNNPPDEQEEPPQVRLVTSEGTILIELFTAHTSAAVKFKELVEAGYYDNTIFHEVRQGEWIVGGQYNASLERNAEQTLVNDSSNGLRNLQGRVSLYGSTAISGDEPHVPQFLINLADNPELDFTPSTGQAVDYTVIGRVVGASGLTIANTIGSAETTTTTTADGTSLSNIPAQNIVITSASVFTGPLADAGEDRIAVAGMQVELGGFTNEADEASGELNFEWTQTGGTTVTLSSTTDLHPTFTVPDDTGTLTFTLTATDAEDRTGTDEVTITVDGDFITTASGLQYKDVVVGTGDLVAPESTIRVLYTGRLTTNWEIFDSTASRNDEPSEFSLGGLIEGWKEGLGTIEMREGGKRWLIIPPDLGYGAGGSPPRIPPNATLFFEVEVVEVVEPPAP